MDKHSAGLWVKALMSAVFRCRIDDQSQTHTQYLYTYLYQSLRSSSFIFQFLFITVKTSINKTQNGGEKIITVSGKQTPLLFSQFFVSRTFLQINTIKKVYSVGERLLDNSRLTMHRDDLRQE